MRKDAINVRRRRSTAFAIVPHPIAKDPSLSDKAIRLWLLLACYADYSDRECWPTIRTLAKEMGCSTRSVTRTLPELVSRRLLEISSGKEEGGASVYVLVDNPGDNQGGYDTGVLGGTTLVSEGGTTLVSYPIYKQDPFKQDPVNEKHLSRTFSAQAFATFWQTYPSRNGRKLGKKSTEALFAKIPEADLQDLQTATEHYAEACSNGTFAKDPERFLKAEYWRGWLGEVADSPRRAHSGPSLQELIDEAQALEDERKRKERTPIE
ncbi:MAG: helix-turn-helix domain-containing protein [Patescibacteria group bacterium]|nr:helix-turn-helix domain-containing protein [Patescibacteria group bacterium]